MANKNRTVYRRNDGQRVNKQYDSDKASSVHNTQKEPENAAKEMLRNQGGGEVTIKGENGRIRDKDTVKPGKDPNPPKDKEH